LSTELLKKVYLFNGLSMSELVEILKLCRQKSFRKDDIIFDEGSPGDSCFIVEKGSVRISKVVPNAGEEALTVMHAGDYFGEMSLIDGANRSASAIANEDTLCLIITKNDLDRLMAEDALLGNKLLRSFCTTLAARLRGMNDKLTQFLAMAISFGGRV